MLCDPQTSGGLLVSVEESSIQSVITVLDSFDLPSKVIGEIVEKREPVISI